MNSKLTVSRVNSNTATKNEKTMRDIIEENRIKTYQSSVAFKLNKIIDDTLSVNIPDNWNESKEKIAEAQNLIATILFVIEYQNLYCFEHYDITSDRLDQIILTVDESRLDKLFENVETMRGLAEESEASEKDYCELYCVLKAKETDDTKIDLFFEKIGLEREFEEYKKVNCTVNKFLSVDNRNRLLLGRDEQGNTLWADSIRDNSEMKITYCISITDHEGHSNVGVTIKKGQLKEFEIQGWIADYDIDINNETDDASARLKIWNTINTYRNMINEDIESAYGKFTEHICDILKDSNGKKGLSVYVERIKNEIRVGVWVDEMEDVFKGAGIEGIDYKTFQRKIQTDGRLERPRNRGGYQHSVSNHSLKDYGRASKAKYVYLFRFEDNIKEMMFEIMNKKPDQNSEKI